MTLSKRIKESLKLVDECTSLATSFANLMMDHGGSLYSGISLKEKGFAFSYGPTTHGMSRYVELPYTLLDEPEQLKSLAEQEKEKIEKHRRESTCECCGMSKLFINGIYHS